MLLMNSHLERDHKICGVNGRLTPLTTQTHETRYENVWKIEITSFQRLYRPLPCRILIFGFGSWSWMNLNVSINRRTRKSNTNCVSVSDENVWHGSASAMAAISNWTLSLWCVVKWFPSNSVDRYQGSGTESNTAWSRGAIDLFRIDALHHGNIINLFHLHVLISWWFPSTGTRGTNTRWRHTKSKNHREKERGNLSTENGNQTDWIELP